MFFGISRSRHAPLLRVAIGVALFVIGIFVLTRIMWAGAAAYVLWGAVSGVSRMRGGRRAVRNGMTGGL